jgi:putative transposase
VFYYSGDRGGVHPQAHLADYAGILQADAFGGYGKLYEAGRRPGPITQAACWGHARRRFFVLADRPNQVWCADITYIPMRQGFLYLVAVMDWSTQKVLSWRVSTTMDAEFCIEALEEALSRFGRPEIFNTDQGGQPEFNQSSQRSCELV